MTEVERRTMERFSLEVPASLSTSNNSGTQEAIEAMTSDICAGGAFFITDKPLSIGTDVKMNLIVCVNKDYESEETKTCIDVSGCVIRTDERGMAVCFDKKYNISPFDE